MSSEIDRMNRRLTDAEQQIVALKGLINDIQELYKFAGSEIKQLKKEIVELKLTGE